MDLDEVRGFFAQNSRAGGAVRLVAYDEIELGKTERLRGLQGVD